MKKFLFSLILLLVSYVGFSQKGLSYQAVILDPAKIEIPGLDISNQPLVNGDVWLKFSISNGSTLQFEEVHKTKTDNYGLVNLLIGSVSSASFNSLVWDGSQKSLQVYVSFNQGGSYTKISDQKLSYNPYALFAETAGKLSGVLPVANGGTGATTAADARANLGLDQVNNTSDAAKPVSAATKAALDLKANTADMTAALAAKADTGTIKTFVVTQVAAANIADADATTKGKIQLAGDLAGTADAPTVPGLALKANEADVTTALALKANTADVTAALDLKANATDVTTALASKANGANVSASLSLKEAVANKSLNVSADGSSDLKYPSVKAVKTYVDAQVTAGVSSATIADASPSSKGKIQLAGDLGGTAAMPTVPGLALKAPIASPTFTGTVSTGTLSSTNISALTYASAPRELTYTGSAINWTPAQGLNAAITLTQNSDLNFTSPPPVGSYGTVVLTQDATGNRTITLPSIPNVSNKVLGSTSTSTVALSTAANSKDILNFYYDGTNCYWNIGQGYGTAASSASSTANLASGVTGTLPLANGGTGATTASAALTSLGGAPLASPTFTGTVSTSALSSTSITAPTYASTPIALTYTGTNINWNPALGLNAAITLTQNSGLNFTAAPPVGSYGTVVLTQDATGNRTITLPSITNVTNKVLGSTSTSTVALSTAANSKDILNFYYDGTNCYWNIGQGYGAAASGSSSTANLASGVTGTLPLANGGTGATTASAALTSLGAAPIASPTFTGAVTSPIYASTPQTLTDASTINWNPSLGLNASVTLGGNRTLSFSTTPVAGAYGTLVINQDATGNRTITLPTMNGVTNKVLGSTSTTNIGLSTAAYAKDIVNFYFDGTICYWNIGQGYGSASSSSTSTNLASGVTGTLAVANGGTGATTLTGLVKGNGTGAMTAAVAGTDYQAPLTLTTTGTGAATLSGTTLNIPTPASGSSSAAVFLPTIVIGTQQWSRLNLDVVTYRNGDIIPQVTDEATWNSLTTGAWCYYNNDPANGAIYGKLYNWYAVNDPRGLAPTGWHIPTDAEWGILIDKLNSYPGILDKKLKTVGPIWSNNIGATNESGFSGLPGGTRAGGSFSRLGQIGMWWSSGICAYSYLEYTLSDMRRSGSNSEFGISVRCVRD